MRRRVTTNVVDAAASVVFLALAAVVMVEGSRLGAGWDPQGPQAGFFPFWLAVLMGLGAIPAFFQALRARGSPPFFERRQEIVDLAKVGLPLVATVVAIPWIGIYVATWLYIWLFAWWYGGFRWWSAFLGGLCFAGAMYLGLAKAAKISMPLSVFYEKGILPF
jgi:putative tricarboxylic transport membrane protein